MNDQFWSIVLVILVCVPGTGISAGGPPGNSPLHSQRLRGKMSPDSIAIPFFDDFPVPPAPDSAYWINRNGAVTARSVNPPSPGYALTLDGYPWGGDTVMSRPMDLTGYAGTGQLFSYWYQLQGNGNVPELFDSLVVEFKNDLGEWRTVRAYPGAPVFPFENEIIPMDSLYAGPGATFFYSQFQPRFRSRGTASNTSHFDHWFVDNVYLGHDQTPPVMSVHPALMNDMLLVGDMDVRYLTISNQQPLPGQLSFSIFEEPMVNWLSITPPSGSIGALQSMAIEVVFDATGLPVGYYQTQLLVNGNDPANPADTVQVSLTVFNPPPPPLPDSLHFELMSGERDSVSFTLINNTPLLLPVRLEVQALSGPGCSKTEKQAQRQTPRYEKGALEPVFPPITAGSGGPDAYGYRWIDSDEPVGPHYFFIDISSTGTVIFLLADNLIPKMRG